MHGNKMIKATYLDPVFFCVRLVFGVGHRLKCQPPGRLQRCCSRVGVLGWASMYSVRLEPLSQTQLSPGLVQSPRVGEGRLPGIAREMWLDMPVYQAWV